MSSPTTLFKSLGASLSDRLQELKLGYILAIAGVLRVASIFVLKNYLHPESWEFGIIASGINRGLGYTYPVPNTGHYFLNGSPYAPPYTLNLISAVMPPGYPYFLAWFLRTFGDRPGTYLTIELIQAVFGVLLVYVVYRTAKSLLSQKAANLAALICALYPAQIETCNEFHSFSFYVVLGVSVIYFLNRYMNQTNSWKDIVWAGLCMGLMLPFRAEALAPMFLYAVCLVIRKGARALGPALLFAAISALCISPWVIRNYKVFGVFVPTETTPGWNLWLGHNPSSTGSNHYDWIQAQSIQPGMRADLDRVPLDVHYEIAIDQVFRKYARDYIRTHPRREVELAAKKLFIFFVFDPTHQKGSLPTYWIPSILLSCFAAYGAFLQRKRIFREDLLLTVSILYALLLGVALFVLPRYKMVVDPYIMIFAAAVVDRKTSRTVAGESVPVALPLETRAGSLG